MKRTAWATLGLVAMAGGVAAWPRLAAAQYEDELARSPKPSPRPPPPPPPPPAKRAPPPPPRPPRPRPVPKAKCVPIPAGTFMMGSTNGNADEKPVHSVTVAAFCMDRTEVTVAAYDACVKAGKCTSAHTGAFCNVREAGRENHPINGVDWNQATAYCEAQGQRLPTEEEWEYAARGADGREYPWGNDAPSNQLCWDGEGNDLGKGNRMSTCLVGAHPKGRSPFGLEDMSGNVWEWTSSAYSNSYSESRGSTARVVRGGSWSSGLPSFVRSAFRIRGVPSYQNDNLGFRCAGASPD